MTVRRTALGALLVAALVVPARAGLAPESSAGSAGNTGTVDGIAAPGYTAEVPLVVQGSTRAFRLHVPEGLLGPAPLVVALHGIYQTAEAMVAATDLEALADREGFVVAFGRGTNARWNAGACCGNGVADDVAYLDALVDHVANPALSRVTVDTRRVFVTGFSNGGMMALRYACERPERVAAAAVVGATVTSTPCGPSSPVAVLDVHGELDAAVPLRGGRNAQLDVTLPPVAESLRPFRDLTDEVRLRVVPGAGHGWFTEERGGYDASAAVWEWLRDHPRRPSAPLIAV